MKTIISEYTRTWKYDNEESYSGVSFSLDNKPSERILLVKDIWYPGTWNIHFLGEFSEGEKQTLMTKINNYIKSGEYLTSCGCCTPEDISGFQRFSFNTSLWEDTGMIRTLKDKETGSPRYFPILKRK